LTRLRLLLLVAYVLLIFFASSRPYLSSPGPDFPMKDKVVHATEYAILGLLLYGGIRFSASRSRVVTFFFLLAVGLSIGALDELFQGYIPGRRTDFYDWVADGVGLSLMIGTMVFTARRKVMRGAFPPGE